mgnify:FL=1
MCGDTNQTADCRTYSGTVRIARVSGELHRVDKIYIETKHLQRKHRCLVPNVTADYVALNAQNAAGIFCGHTYLCDLDD